MFVSMLGFFIKSLTVSGALAAFAVGSLISLGFGIQGLVILGAFFLTSSLWSKYKRRDKVNVDQITEKGERRDFTQVMANGLIPSICSFMYWVYPSDYLLVAFLISISAANSDTWASEIGSLSKKAPIHVLKLRKVEPGTSGAISLLGTFATVCGAFLISVLGLILFKEISIILMIIIGVSGVMGSLFDTIIGATLQVKYQCQLCRRPTEKRIHCRKPTIIVSGVGWINNDLTNFLSIILATLIGVLAVFLIELLG
nr:DUF92 domain-containing protein [Bacillus pinisoli]